MPHSFNSTLKWTGKTDYIAVGAGSVQSVAFDANTFEIRVVSNANCHINIGANPTAAATDNNGMYLPAGVVDYLHVNPGQKLAVIQDAASTGTIAVSEMTR